MLLGVCALVLLDWLAVLHFLELCLVLCMLLALYALILLDWLAVLCFLLNSVAHLPFLPLPGLVGFLLQQDAAQYCQD
jgi:hypothetical protein